MELGLHIADFTWAGGPPTMGADLARIVRTADDAGFAKISVMDHVWQIHMIGPPEHDMLEAYTALGFIAAHTERAQLLAWVTAVVYRAPGLLAKAVSTLDVLSGGRAMLGIGAAWNEEESVGLGLDFPGTGERFERLEEALEIYLQMCSDSDAPYEGAHYRLGRTLNVPQTLSRPHPPILIGGGGEKKTLRMVAQYADACNLFDVPELPHKLDVLRQHCSDLGRDYDTIEKTVMMHRSVAADGTGLDEFLGRLAELAALGVQHVHHRPANFSDPAVLEYYGEVVIPEAAKITPAA